MLFRSVIMKGESRVFNKEAGVRDTRIASAVLRGRKSGHGSTTSETNQERRRELAQAEHLPWVPGSGDTRFPSDTRDGPEGERWAVLHDASLGPPGLSVGASVPPTVCMALGGICLSEPQEDEQLPHRVAMRAPHSPDVTEARHLSQVRGRCSKRADVASVSPGPGPNVA